MVLLRGEDAKCATDTAEAIALDLSSLVGSSEGLPRHSASQGELAGGYAGICLLFHEMERASGDAKWTAIRELCWERTVASIGELDRGADFFTGVCGAAWVGARLSRPGSEIADEPRRSVWSSEEEFDLTHIDEYAFAALRNDRLPLADHLGGLAGLATYFSTRSLTSIARQALEDIVNRLDAMAAHDARGTYWSPAPERIPRGADPLRFSVGCAPLGAAHGLAGVLGALARCVELGVASATAARLFEGGAQFLLASRIPTARGLQFPATVHRDGRAAPPASTWCWGDIGIIGVAHAAARRIHHADLEQAMVEAASCLSEIDPVSHRLPDACLCHGFAGRAHILNRLYAAMGLESLRRSATAWIRATLAARGERGIGGYLFDVHRDGQAARLPSAGFLIGSAGVALALLAACRDGESPIDLPFGLC